VRILKHVDDLRSEDSDNPVYEVTFWGRSEVSDRLPEDRSFEAEVWQLADADVKEVIEWADSKVRDDRTYQIAVAVSDHDTVSNLVRLYGQSPIKNVPQTAPAWFDAGPNGLSLR
jgi:hypothetical protein